MASNSIQWTGHTWTGSLDVPSTATVGESISGSVEVEQPPLWSGEVKVSVQRRQKTSPVAMSDWSTIEVIGKEWGMSSTMSGSFSDTVPETDRVDYRILLEFSGQASLVSDTVTVDDAPETTDDSDSGGRTVTIGAGPTPAGPVESETPETPDGVPDSATKTTRTKVATAADSLESKIRSASWTLWRDGYDVYDAGRLIGTLDPVAVHGGVSVSDGNQTDQPNLVNPRSSGLLDISQEAYQEAVVDDHDYAPISEYESDSGGSSESGLIGSDSSSDDPSAIGSSNSGSDQSSSSEQPDVDLDEWGAPQNNSSDTAGTDSSGSDSSSDGSDGLPTGALVAGGAVALAVILR